MHGLVPAVKVTATSSVADRLVTAIAVGVYSPGECLPPEREMATSLGVSRVTVRQALKQVAELGLVGKAPGRYNLHLGGNRIGTRIPRMYRENITEPEILDIIDELVGRWAAEREPGEGFGDFTVRAGIIRPVLDPARDFWE